MFELGLGEVRELQVLEQDVEILVPAESELKRILSAAVRAAFPTARTSATLGRAGQGVALAELLVARKHVALVPAIRGEPESRLADPFRRNLHVVGIFGEVADLAFPEGARDGLPQFGARHADEALVIAMALSFWIETAL